MSRSKKYSDAETGNGGGRNRKTSSINFRIEERLKGKLQDIATKEARTLSSLLERILKTFLDHDETDSPLNVVEQDKRFHRRNKIPLPARWRIGQGENSVDYDVIIKDISRGGAYTEYVNGKNFQFLKNLQVKPLALVVRLPKLSEPIALECEASRFHITKNTVGVGLRFSDRLDQVNILP